MATMSELNAEYHILKATHERLIEERAVLHTTDANGAAFQDHAHRTRLYAAALETYLVKLDTRRQELSRRNGPSASTAAR
jgi:hypothetical protein